jgi:hypothetical protein
VTAKRYGLQSDAVHTFGKLTLVFVKDEKSGIPGQ